MSELTFEDVFAKLFFLFYVFLKFTLNNKRQTIFYVLESYLSQLECIYIEFKTKEIR